MSINIIDCPSGYGVNELEVQCQRCSVGYFNIFPSHTDPCYLCNENENIGIRCTGGNDIIISRHHWLSFNEDKTELIEYLKPKSKNLKISISSIFSTSPFLL